MILNYSTELKLVYDTLEIELMLCCNHINTEHRLSVIKYFFHSPVIMMFLRENQGMILQPDLAGKVMITAALRVGSVDFQFLCFCRTED